MNNNIMCVLGLVVLLLMSFGACGGVTLEEDPTSCPDASTLDTGSDAPDAAADADADVERVCGRLGTTNNCPVGYVTFAGCEDAGVGCVHASQGRLLWCCPGE